MKNTQGQFFYLPLRCKCCIRSRCHSFMHCSISFRGKNSASAFPPQLPLLHICDPAGVYGNNYRNVVCPSALRSLKTLRALNLGKNKPAVMCVEIADSRPQQRYPFRIACALRLPR